MKAMTPQAQQPISQQKPRRIHRRKHNHRLAFALTSHSLRIGFTATTTYCAPQLLTQARKMSAKENGRIEMIRPF